MKSRSEKREGAGPLRKRTLWSVAIVLVVLLVVRIWAPSLIRSHVNQVLSELDGFSGSIEDVDLSLIRGAYRVDGLVLEKEGWEAKMPFMQVRSMDLSVEWLALFRGALVGELILDEPNLVLVLSDDEDREQLGGEGNWVEAVQSLFPFTLDRFEVVDGTIAFGVDEEGPLAKARANSLQLVASDISNVDNRKGEELPSQLVASAKLGDGTPMRLEGRFDLISDPMEMDMNFECEPIDLPYLNPLLESYANIDVQSGQLGLYAEWAVSAQEVEGYVKFLARGIDVFELGSEGGNPLSALWDAFAGFLITLTENHSKDQFAAKVPFSGSRADFKAGLLPTLGSLLKNAFVQALKGDVDGSISIADLGSKEH